MIVRTLKKAMNSPRKVSSDGWESIRLLLKDDGMGFSFHITTIFEGAHLNMHYQNHLESVFCLSGKGEIVDQASGKTHKIEPGVLYALDKNDKHTLIAKSEMIMACVFNPPLNGREVHNKEGAYELETPPV
ncbi:MAG: ectoine synthase [Pseudomonadales bacterium]|nr:ectoine synthase [Pseudomonadales bacterium]